MPGRLGIDIGAGRADFMLLDTQSGAAHALKIKGDALPDVVSRGIVEIAAEAGIDVGRIEHIVHASDSAAMPAGGAAARVGLLVTQGFEDLHATGGVDAALTACVSAVAGVAERMSAAGNVLTPMDETQATTAIENLLHAGVDAIAVVLMQAPANPAHEQRLAEMLAERSRHVPVFLSSTIAPAPGERGRAVATIAAAASGPELAARIEAVEIGASAAGINPRVDVGLAHGGHAGRGTALDNPAAAHSGAAAGGAIAAAQMASAAGFPDAVGLDLGGGAATLSLSRKGKGRVANALPIGGARAGLSAMDVRDAGPGVGAVATVPVPGVIAFAESGDGPTVHDANVVLGRLPVARLGIDPARSEQAVATFARQLDCDHHGAAEAIVEVFQETLAARLRALAVEKGEDPARLALVAGGGAGPLHGCALGAAGGFSAVVIPPRPGVLSAMGLAMSAPAHQISRHVGRPVGRVDPADAAALIADLDARAATWLADEGLSGDVTHLADLRWPEGDYTASIPVDPDTLPGGGLAELVRRFSETCQRRFGRAPDGAVELSALRAIVSGGAVHVPAPAPMPAGGGDARSAALDETQVYFDGGFVAARVHDRARLAPGNTIMGPALIVEPDATTVVVPGVAAEVDRSGSLILRVGGVEGSHG